MRPPVFQQISLAYQLVTAFLGMGAFLYKSANAALIMRRKLIIDKSLDIVICNSAQIFSPNEPEGFL